MTVAKRRSSSDDKVEAKRKIIRRSLDEITADVACESRKANMCAGVNIGAPTRHTLLTITGQIDMAIEEWSRVSEVVRQMVGKSLERRGYLADHQPVPRLM
jgi:hypothetical protein